MSIRLQSTTPLTTSPQRDLALDGLRGLAILMVLCVHYFRFEPDHRVWIWLTNACKSGWLGVDLFFCLSGFLITRLLLADREQPHRFRDFYARRALRILPAYYAFLLVVFFVLGHPELEGWGLPFTLFYQNVAIIQQQSFTPWRGVDPLWSLAVEEQFYLLWPPLLYLTPARRLLPLCLSVIATAWATKLICLRLDWPMTFYFLTPARMDALGGGALAAVAWQYGRDRQHPAWHALLPVLTGLLMVLAVLFVQNRGFGAHRPLLMLAVSTLAAPAFALLVLAASQPQRFPRLCAALANRPLLFLGRYSYGLYLVHLAWGEGLQYRLQSAMASWLPGNWSVLGGGLAVTALALTNAILMYHLLEAPILRLRRYFIPTLRAGGT